MASGTPSGSSRSQEGCAPILPAGFTTLGEVLEEAVAPGQLIRTIGIVKDCRLPIATSRTDWKMTVTLHDMSTQNSSSNGVDLIIFRPEAEMPQVNVGDVVLAYNVRVQKYRFVMSLITNFSTDLHIYDRSKIPEMGKSAALALIDAKRKTRSKPSPKEHEAVSMVYHSVDKDMLPTDAEFQDMALRSTNINEKFALAKDIKDGRFHDMIVQLVKEPYNYGSSVTIYVTDYTDNPEFFNYSWNGASGSEGTDADPYGYMAKFSKPGAAKQDWSGPFGKKTLQVSCWEPHANVLREAKVGDWLLLSNLQVRYGKDSVNLEGFLRQDQSYENRIYVDILDLRGDPESIDPRLKDALRRKRDYEKSKTAQLKRLKAETNGKKRKVQQEEKPPNAKDRRKATRKAIERKIEDKMMRGDSNIDRRAKEHFDIEVNENVKTENTDRELSSVSDILKPVIYNSTIDNQATDIQVPFTCAKYRTLVRVVDFRPKKLEDFASSRKVDEYEMLSDASEDSDSSSEDSDDKDGTLDRYTGKRIWEWRFALQLEDISPTQLSSQPPATANKSKSPERMWVVVDNSDAQMLTGLDACDLRRNPDQLHLLREGLFTLWGDLEEKKVALEQREKALMEQEKTAAVAATRSAVGRAAVDKPPLDSSDNEGPAAHPGRSLKPDEKGEAKLMTINNKPFSCCIKQYGIRQKTTSPQEADGADGKRWERVFGLFGTKISC